MNFTFENNRINTVSKNATKAPNKMKFIIAKVSLKNTIPKKLAIILIMSKYMQILSEAVLKSQDTDVLINLENEIMIVWINNMQS